MRFSKQGLFYMIKKLSYAKAIPEEDILDITIFYEKGRIVRYSLNYRAWIKGRFREI